MQVEYESGEDRIRAERVAPEGGPHPGVIVVHDARGFSEHVAGVARELAERGYVALAVDLYSRAAPAADITIPDLKTFVRSVPDRQVVGDLQAAIHFLARDPAVDGRPIGLIGYCWGGFCAFLAAGSCEGLAAAVSWYGELRLDEQNGLHPEHPIDVLRGRRCPVTALFAEHDRYVPLDHVDALRARHAEDPGEHTLEIEVYPGVHHGFAHRGREHFDAAAHDAGWQRIDALFEPTPQAEPSPAQPT